MPGPIGTTSSPVGVPKLPLSGTKGTPVMMLFGSPSGWPPGRPSSPGCGPSSTGVCSGVTGATASGGRVVGARRGARSFFGFGRTVARGCVWP
jgi:hypothetical protein